MEVTPRKPNLEGYRNDSHQEGVQSIRFDGANEGEGDFYRTPQQLL
jgi:hypothetical protein